MPSSTAKPSFTCPTLSARQDNTAAVFSGWLLGKTTEARNDVVPCLGNTFCVYSANSNNGCCSYNKLLVNKSVIKKCHNVFCSAREGYSSHLSVCHCVCVCVCVCDSTPDLKDDGLPGSETMYRYRNLQSKSL